MAALLPRPLPEPTPAFTGAGDLVPLAIWPCAQTSAQYQRTGRYLSANSRHPGKMLPELARQLVAEYCPPGGLVVDPMCGIGTTLVEAAALGRRAVGVELAPRWATLARANLDHAVPADQAGLAEIRVGDARRLPQLLADLAGQVDLVVTSPPYACEAGVIDKAGWRAGHPLCPRDSLNYSRDPANLGRARGPDWRAGISQVLAGCAQLLRPGGLLVTVTKNTRRAGRLNDLATATVQLAGQAGFGYLQHLIALHAGVRNGGLVARPSFWQLTQTRRARARGEPAHLVVHEDVLVFTTPRMSASSGKLKDPQRGPKVAGGSSSLMNPWVGGEAMGPAS
jgi:modification methylase